jgi:2-polyprenyl-3-methyl-5-hydroxy-6-metoxy-1,4-benzoquinol methylase
MTTSDYKNINKATWDERAKVHFDSDFYNVKDFLAGNSSLNELELSLVGDVKGKSLLHLQCHFGLDTLSWARLGAQVTGVDLSEQAIKQANQLAEQTGLNAQFIASDLYDFGEQNQQQYDLVFTSYGAICWLPDIHRWAKTVANSLKPEGKFVIAEFHPIYDLVAGYSYFHQEAPDVEEESTYTENHDGKKLTTVVWSHHLSSVVNALIEQGLTIELMTEQAGSPYNCFPDLTQENDGLYYLYRQGVAVPLIYSITAKK